MGAPDRWGATWSGIAISARERSSAKRLEVAWQERDAMLDGEEAMSGNGKVYTCHCGETFPDRWRRAQHGHVHKPYGGQKPRKVNGRQEAGKPRRAPQAKSNGTEPPCPTCAHRLRVGSSVVIKALQAAGFTEEQALLATATSQGMWVVPE